MNHRINRQAWDACMAALKPTRKQLEHGLGLHAESVVVDAYGLGIYARPSRKGALDILNTLERKMKEGASVRELIDFQEEMGQIINGLRDPFFMKRERQGEERLMIRLFLPFRPKVEFLRFVNTVYLFRISGIQAV